ncbi:efflux RND transporter periplasmic adaptor subunit [Opitutus terrae]|uniref:Efflux transporter, RND family, MFP subunit n=1 Tax=Opitutus terrae (strain DSM 11246 / JCM 15787 / PB90-1) TaxID=452637 RepID=B1ZXY2_OPITP|nr:efflux RND transporter periplasmic adaptor subunit [Opitutus terrae]ACB75184.1 efflux transporter, RND family, MFP subunit [Opitutus terrae PB90-1]
MDIPRPSQAKAKLKKRIILGSVVALALIGITVLLARLKPAAPTVERNLVWIADVKRGQMLRQVRGLGTLVPEEITWIAARTQGRVDKIVLRPGATVTPDSVILVLTNPDVVRASADADSQLRAAEAQLTNLKVQIESSVLAAEAAAASAKADFERYRLQAEVNDELFKDGLVSPLDVRVSKVTAEQAATRYTIEQKRYAFTKDSVAPQLAVQEAEVERLRSMAKLRREELEALTVRAGMNGVLQILPVDVGAQVQPGSNLARVADPRRLKAEIRIAETQARDIEIGQVAQIDTRNGVVAGKVGRIDPSVQNGTVTVDVFITDELPRGARPDLSVDGTIELERLENVVYVGRPAFGQEQTTVGIFKLDENSSYATRTQVKLGRSSVNTIEVLAGLEPGDRVILSDMSQWDSNDRVKLN